MLATLCAYTMLKISLDSRNWAQDSFSTASTSVPRSVDPGAFGHSVRAGGQLRSGTV